MSKEDIIARIEQKIEGSVYFFSFSNRHRIPEVYCAFRSFILHLTRKRDREFGPLFWLWLWLRRNEPGTHPLCLHLFLYTIQGGVPVFLGTLVISRDDWLVGKLLKAKGLWFCGFQIASSWRNRGLGQLVFSLGEELLRERMRIAGIKKSKINLFTAAPNAAHIYEKYGWLRRRMIGTKKTWFFKEISA